VVSRPAGASKTSRGPFLAAEGETWVTMAYYEELLEEVVALEEQLEVAREVLQHIASGPPTWCRDHAAQVARDALDPNPASVRQPSGKTDVPNQESSPPKEDA